MNLIKKCKKHPYLLYGIGGLTAGFLNGLFGSGGGTVIVPFMEEFLDFEEHESHATAIFVILGFTLISLFFYGKSHSIDFATALPVSIGGIGGGFLGAKLLKKMSGNLIRKIFGAFMLIAAVRMVFFR